ncbi:MAG TPA: CDP-alcohol phosphatidyltransferase family protein [Chthoniobacterales bacterium]|nr:CDP-alcohol phosphatidyltransferase family protein [Chthoniobacterales bacterium]
MRGDPLEKSWPQLLVRSAPFTDKSWIIIAPRSLVNSLSLSRIGLGLLFVLCFQRSATLLYVSIALCLVALATDVFDGFLARRLHVTSIQGRLWDSLGDKSFYAAIIIAFSVQGFLDPLVSWALIVREITLYVTRVLYVENLPKIEQIRPSTNWHGYFMYVTIVLGLSRMYADIHGFSYSIHPYMQASAYAALACGVISIIHFLKLR